jgi:hypothetical protein
MSEDENDKKCGCLIVVVGIIIVWLMFGLREDIREEFRKQRQHHDQEIRKAPAKE